MRRTEVQRITGELIQSRISGESLLRKFRSASRADVKLACALQGYFAERNDAYLPYLKSRIRPTVAELVLAGRTADLGKLDGLGIFTEALTDAFLELAISACVPDSIIWLLKLKERRFGFDDRELEL